MPCLKASPGDGSQVTRQVNTSGSGFFGLNISSWRSRARTGFAGGLPTFEFNLFGSPTLTRPACSGPGFGVFGFRFVSAGFTRRIPDALASASPGDETWMVDLGACGLATFGSMLPVRRLERLGVS